MNAQVQSAPAAAYNVGDKDRRTYIGGSDIGAVLGIDPYDRTPLTVYLQKIGELQGITDPDKLRFLARRKRWEGPIVAMLREEFEGEIVSVNQRYEDPELDFLAAEIDFEWRDRDGSIQSGEIKTVSSFAFGERHGWGEAGTDQIPLHYHAQVMHGLGITKRQRAIVCAMSGLDTMTFYNIERDDEAIVGMREIAADFWHKHVLARVPPPPTTMHDVMRMFAKRRGRPVELDEKAAEALQKLRHVRTQQAALKDEEAAYALEVAQFVCDQWGVATPEEAEKDNAELRFLGQKLATWAACRGAHLDQKRLAEEHPEIKTAYTVPHYFRSFRFATK